MNEYRHERAESCLNEADEARDIVENLKEEYPRTYIAFTDAYNVLNNIDPNSSDALIASNIIFTSQQNGHNIVDSLKNDDQIIRVEGHVRGMCHQSKQDPKEYIVLAFNAVKTQYQLYKKGEIGGNEEEIMARYALLNAAVLELESKN